MTTTLIVDASTAPPVPTARTFNGSAAARAPRGAGSAEQRAPKLTFAGVVRSERIKLLSLRSVRITLLVTLVFGVGLSALLAMVWRMQDMLPVGGTDPEAAQQYLLMVATFAAPFLALIFGVLGVFAMASEYSSGMILSTLAAVPQRTPVLVAKGLVIGAVAGVCALALVALGLLSAVIANPVASSEVFSAVVVSGVLGTVLYLVLITLFAFGIATLLRSTAGGIAVVAGVTFVLPIAMQLLAITGWEWVPTVATYLPAALGGSLAAGTAASDPSFAVAALAMVLWALAALIPAAITFRRRDAS